ncbi:hypothetical protein KR044_003891 [Drosophila immigrans]|nr:hypothetical protein KR044_003891 [Drosophila immigrans]
MMFNKYYCNFNRQDVSNFSLQIQNGMINMDTWIIKTLHVGLRGHLDFEFRPPKIKNFQSIFQYDLDFCSMYKITRNTLVRRWYISMLKKGNFSATCPMEPGYYYLHGWTADGNMVPSFFLNGAYRVTGSFYYGKFRKDNNMSVLICSIHANLID